jgi:hypothetical protein
MKRPDRNWKEVQVLFSVGGVAMPRKVQPVIGYFFEVFKGFFVCAGEWIPKAHMMMQFFPFFLDRTL